MKRQRQTLYIGDKRWKIQFCALRDRRGDCNIEKKLIRIDSRLVGQERVEVLVHEIAHAVMWVVDETAITDLGVAVASALATQGLLNTEE